MTVKVALAGLAVIGGGGYLTTLAYVQWVTSSDDAKIKNKFNSPITLTVDLDDYVSRSEVELSLRNILTCSSTKFANYWIISGEQGTGKTTTIQKVCKDIGKGIIYVDVPPDVEDFKNALSKAIDFNYRHHSGIGSFVHQSVYGRERLPGNFYYNILI